MRHLLAATLLATSLCSVVVTAGLTLSKRCGEKTCAEHEFCSEYDLDCRPCNDVCELGSHNYQEAQCQKDCQDYLHDRLYAKRGAGDLNALIERVDKLYRLGVAVLVLLVLVLLALVALPLFSWLKARHHEAGVRGKLRKKLAAINAVSAVTPAPGPAREVDVDVAGQRAAFATTPAPRRFPSEDTALGGPCCYDNPALTPSPVLDKTLTVGHVTNLVVAGKRESSF